MEKKITDGKVINLKDVPKKSYLGNFLFHYRDLDLFKYILIIESLSPRCLKLSIYPINEENVAKFTFYGRNIPHEEKSSEEKISQIIKLLSQFKVIHTSGLIIKKEKTFFECYLNINLSNIKNSIIHRIKRFANSLNLEVNIEKINS
ncbi:MAG: hypothetical protein EU547_00235 [Promethearchaeota archaeon]|nr:MAG: hypothetical protein EU547_00235 [Candidatus Lokiarchaeota archaeon]